MPTKQFFYKNNRLQQLKGFYYTVQKGGVAKAAEHMSVTQSAVSTQINSLERDLGVKLFDRSKRSLSLTKDGRLLYRMAVEPLQNLESIYERFLMENKYAKQFVDISANHISILYLLPNVIKKFKSEHEDVQIMIRNIAREDAMERLMSNETDLCLYPFINIPEECDFIPVADYDPILLVRRDHPLASLDNPSLADVAKYDLVRIDPHLITLPHFEEVVKNNKLGSNIKFENGDWEMLKALVTAEVGVAIISNVCLRENEDILIGIPLKNYFPTMTYGFCTKKGVHHRKSVQRFLEAFKKEC